MTTKETIAKFSSQVLTSSEVRAYTVELLQSVLDGLPEEETRNDSSGNEERRLGYNQCLYRVRRQITNSIAELKEGNNG